MTPTIAKIQHSGAGPQSGINFKVLTVGESISDKDSIFFP